MFWMIPSARSAHACSRCSAVMSCGSVPVTRQPTAFAAHRTPPLVLSIQCRGAQPPLQLDDVRGGRDLGANTVLPQRRADPLRRGQRRGAHRGTPLQGFGIGQRHDPHDQPGLALAGVRGRADQGVVDPRVVAAAAPPGPDADHAERIDRQAQALMQQRQQLGDVDGVFGICRRRPGEQGRPVRLAEQLHRHHRNAVLVADSTTGAVVGHRDGFTQGDRATTLAPQDQPRPQRLASPADHPGRHPERQTHCGTGVSAQRPADETGSENADDDRQPDRGGHRSRRARATSDASTTAAATRPANTSATLRAR